MLPEGNDRIHRLLDRCCASFFDEVGARPDDRWALVLSTTKGDIRALENSHPVAARIPLLANQLQRKWGFTTIPWIVSNACASGASAIALAGQLITHGSADHVVVVGVDILSRFVLAGFRSLYALSDGPCSPFDAARNGTSLGEACAMVLLTNDRTILARPIGQLLGSGIAHDANHISGPSRNGEGLVRAVKAAMDHASVKAMDVHAINAHGTGTEYNDAMESTAFERCDLSDVPMSGYKGWFGHTLGAAGVLECAIALRSLQLGHVLRNEGARSIGVPGKVNALVHDAQCIGDVLLKTSSGFGGTNTALVLRVHP